MIQRYLLHKGGWMRLQFVQLQRSSLQSISCTPVFSKTISQPTFCTQYLASKHCRFPVDISKSFSRNYGRYEPDYLDPTGPQVAKYDLVNIQLTGFDFTVLEEFGKFVHNSAERFGLEIEDAWGTPSKHLKITKLKPESTVVDAEYKLQVYERNVQVVDPESTTLPLFIDIVQSSLPAGVTLKVHPHFREYTEIRYVPDLALKEVQGQLEELLSGRKRKK